MEKILKSEFLGLPVSFLSEEQDTLEKIFKKRKTACIACEDLL